MTQPAGTYSRYTAATNVREDLIDAITMTNPTQTPIISASGTGTAANTFHEWQRDNLRTANANNAAIDGDDATGSTKAPPQRVGNYCQIFQDTVITSGRAEVVKKAGMKSAMTYFVGKAYKELQRDMEAMLVSNNVAVLGNNTTAMKAAGLAAMIYTNANHGAGGSTPAHTSGAATVAATPGTGRAFTEALLKAAIQSTYTASGDIPPAVYLSPLSKGVFSGFAGIAVNRYNIPSKKDEQAKVIGGADVYGSDFGDLTIVPHYLMAGVGNVLGLDPEYIDMVYLRSFQSNDLGKTGDAEKKQVLVDATARLRSEMACFAVKDLTGT